MSDISAVTCDVTQKIEITNVHVGLGSQLFDQKVWKDKCELFFHTKYKESKIVTTSKDKITETFANFISKNQGRGFVFKNYDIVDHLVFLIYSKSLIQCKLGIVPKNNINTYLVYIEQKNIIFLCYSIAAYSHVFRYLNYITTSITHFLALYGEKIKSTEVMVIGLLIQQNETKVELLECELCNLFCATYKVFESATFFDKWWKSVENYNNWWNLSSLKKCDALFEDLAAQIIGFMEKEECCLSDISSDVALGRKGIAPNKQSTSLKDAKQPKSQQMQQFISQTSAEVTVPVSEEYYVELIMKKERENPQIVRKTQPDDYFVQSDGPQKLNFHEPQSRSSNLHESLEPHYENRPVSHTERSLFSYFIL